VVIHPIASLAQAWKRRAWARWAPHSRLFPVGDGSGWALDGEIRELGGIARRLGIRVEPGDQIDLARRQAAFFPSIYQWLENQERLDGWRQAAAWYHGRPGQGDAEFDRRHEAVRRLHGRLDRLQVTNRAFREVALATGIDPAKVFLIPIGINLEFFTMQSPQARRVERERLGIPLEAVVVGSFQKDGSGWGEGMEPKWVKGPDAFLKAVEILRPRVPELFVLLSGPARGYVKAGLERLGIPYKHVFCESYPEVGRLYQCLNLYLAASRDEGGPKAVLESMAGGVPLVSTRVGQAADLVRHGENGWLADVDDAEALVAHALAALEMTAADRQALLARARATAEANAYERQDDLWREFFRDFVAMGVGAEGTR
jgi:glycosyltransferase involved in cell wall biosynthesis